MAERVEGADGEAVGCLGRNQLFCALLHLLRRTIGERDRCDVFRFDTALDQVRDLRGDHACLAAAGACKHEQWAIDIAHRRELLRI